MSSFLFKKNDDRCFPNLYRNFANKKAVKRNNFLKCYLCIFNAVEVNSILDNVPNPCATTAFQKCTKISSRHISYLECCHLFDFSDSPKKNKSSGLPTKIE